MDLIDQSLPGGSNIGRVPVVGDVVDEYAEVVVACLVGVLVEELIKWKDLAVKRAQYLRSAFVAETRIRLHALKNVVLNVCDF